MTTAAPSAALVTIQPAFTDAERVALAGYRGLTREAHALDLRQFTSWCRARSLALSAVRRADIEDFARDLEARGGAPRHGHPEAVHHRRVLQVRGRGRTPGSSPAAHVRRPRADYESHAAALDRNELGALLVAVGLGTPGEHALISLPALNGLRVSEATGADTEHLGLERGHRNPDHHPQRRQGRDHAAGTADPLGDRPDHRRALRRGGVPGFRRAAAGPARGHPSSAPARRSRRHPSHQGASRHAPSHFCHDHARRCRCLATCRSLPATLIRGPRCGPPERARSSLDRHATYIVAGYVAYAAR
jgi:integrase/recombinase XerD